MSSFELNSSFKPSGDQEQAIGKQLNCVHENNGLLRKGEPEQVLRLFRDLNLKVLNMEITRSTETETHNACALFTLRLNKRCRVEQLIPKMNATEGVVSVEEL